MGQRASKRLTTEGVKRLGKDIPTPPTSGHAVKGGAKETVERLADLGPRYDATPVDSFGRKSPRSRQQDVPEEMKNVVSSSTDPLADAAKQIMARMDIKSAPQGTSRKIDFAAFEQRLPPSMTLAPSPAASAPSPRPVIKKRLTAVEISSLFSLSYEDKADTKTIAERLGVTEKVVENILRYHIQPVIYVYQGPGTSRRGDRVALIPQNAMNKNP